jgi:3-phenylpropionate/cinnamic acid dioxygenase small subunit
MTASCAIGSTCSPTMSVIGCRSVTISWIVRKTCRKREGYYFDDDKKGLGIRVERVYAKTAWAEMPPSRTRHLISNIRIKKDDGAEIEVHSNFLVYRTRMEADQDIFVGTRQDVLRRVAATFQIARRTIILDQAVLNAKNISVFL